MKIFDKNRFLCKMEVPSHEYLGEWLKGNRSKATIVRMVRKLKNDEEAFLFFLKMVLEPDPVYAARASWVIRTWTWRNKAITHKHYPQLISILEKTNNDSILRNLSGIFIDLGINEKSEGKISHFCFRMLEEKHRAPGVHSNVLALLYDLCKKYPELKDEVRLLTLNHPNSSMPSFRVRIKKFKFETADNNVDY